MQANVPKPQHNGTCTRPAFGSAFLAGHVVTVTVPMLAMSDGLLAIGDRWTALRIPNNDDRMHVLADVAPPVIGGMVPDRLAADRSSHHDE